MTHLERLIHKATGAAEADLPIIEHIMRADVFHSTLDWQNREQLVEGARQAHALLGANRDLYEIEQAAAQAVPRQFSSQPEAKKRPEIHHQHVHAGRGVAPGLCKHHTA